MITDQSSPRKWRYLILVPALMLRLTASPAFEREASEQWEGHTSSQGSLLPQVVSLESEAQVPSSFKCDEPLERYLCNFRAEWIVRITTRHPFHLEVSSSFRLLVFQVFRFTQSPGRMGYSARSPWATFGYYMQWIFLVSPTWRAYTWVLPFLRG